MKWRYLLRASALMCLAAGTVFGEGSQVNISGATLFVDFFRSFASTNDYLDVDGDGIKGFDLWDLKTPDQLAPTNWKSPSVHWIVMYRGVGSGNGLLELVNYHRRAPGMEMGNPTDIGLINRSKFYEISVLGDGDPAHPGSAPTPIKSIDIAVMDVPTTWFVQTGLAANAAWWCTPKADGYGMNPVKSWDASRQSNKLKTLVSSIDPNVVMNVDAARPDQNTIFDTPMAWVPIAFVTNPGTGMENITEEQLQYLFVTGRLPSGENLVAATRDAGSGTRNGAMNSLGIDPSWGRGENVGKKTGEGDSKLAGNLGPNHQVANLGGSSVMEEVVRQNRLAVGYTGLMGASRAAADAQTGLYEILDVRQAGAANYVRPAIGNVLLNDDPNTGWQIGGAETFATVGNPFAKAGEVGMDNPHAADYLRNIKFSIDNFISAPEDPCHSMPGEYMATNYTLVAGLAAIPSPDPSVFVPNPDFNIKVHEFMLAQSVLDVPAHGSVAPAGKVPRRAQLPASRTYSDGRTYVGTDDYYTTSSGEEVRAGQTLTLRNRIAGDFNYDGKRDITDVAALMEAQAHPRLFEAGKDHGGNGFVIPEIIGDFNGDGSFDANDIRYWADGLALVPATGRLNRALAFALVDAHAATGNFFGTRIATGAEYREGASAADVAGSDKVYPGSQPVGADGVVDGRDIDYVACVLRGGPRASAFGVVLPSDDAVHAKKLDWNKLDDAVWMDLSCDMNGDLVIDGADLDVIVHEVLGTQYGDVTLDGRVDQADLDVIAANLNETVSDKGWSDGDVTGDGYVTQADLELARAAQ